MGGLADVGWNLGASRTPHRSIQAFEGKLKQEKKTQTGCELDGNWEAESVIQFDEFDPEQGRLFLVGVHQAKAPKEQHKTLAATPRVLGKYLTQLDCTAVGLFGMVQ